ncbi:hypothetical protein CEXT_283521 [Caerostris extrusa]|uniref:Uncharacterized protein n=1 Tax=Caerostris extrusa TaxID=172846 RepID=A0AAV4WVG2_CAEEX|nr:hypothetical protein CEXT_283521 [Caerostris extrusa]
MFPIDLIFAIDVSNDLCSVKPLFAAGEPTTPVAVVHLSRRQRMRQWCEGGFRGMTSIVILFSETLATSRRCPHSLPRVSEFKDPGEDYCRRGESILLGSPHIPE